jgi:phage tail-like protein
MTASIFASTTFFQLTIAGNSFGNFHTCTGFGAQVEIEQFREGGNNGFAWPLVTRVSYANITLTRPVTADTVKVANWFDRIVHQAEPQDGEIVALQPDLAPITRWQVLGIVPVRWTGPSFDPSSSQPAMETLEIAYQRLTAS